MCVPALARVARALRVLVARVRVRACVRCASEAFYRDLQ